MKKVFALLLVLALVLGAVGCKKEEAGGKITIGFVTDVGGINDKSFNQSSWEGIVKFGTENGLAVDKEIKFIQSATDADLVPNLTILAEEGFELIIGAGYKFEGAVKEVSEKYPNQKMLIIDVGGLEGANVQQAVFAEHEGSFLVGVVAGMAAKEKGHKKVGYIVGFEGGIMEKFFAGFEAGVKEVYPECEILYEVAYSFNDDSIGKTIATKMYNSGAYIIYHAAGGTGFGVITEAAERRKNGQDVWAIGVDSDQYPYGFYDDAKTKSSVLTSMLKRVDVAAYNACKEVKDGTFKGGTVVYNLAKNGVGIPTENPNFKEFTSDFDTALKTYTEKIIKGEIVVPEISPSRK